MRASRTITCLLLACSPALMITNSAATAAEPNVRKNVLFLIADDLNCDLGCYGHAIVKSPNIDRLAARGRRFERAYCQFPLCCPSRASFMCGLYPDQTSIHANRVYVRDRLPNVVTLGQMFRRAGYASERVGKIYHYGVPGSIGTNGHDDPPTWDRVFNPRGRDKDEESQIFTLVPGRYGGTLSWMAAEGTDEEQTDGIGATEAIRLLTGFAESKRPFFLAVGFFRPHTPYVSPKKYFEMYPRDAIVVPNVPAGYLDTLPAAARATLTLKKDQNHLSDKLARQAIQAYYASITFMDAQVGRVLAALERSGLADNTIVMFTSDHGYHMGEHGYYQKMTLFENATHVPLIIAVPGMKSIGQSTAALAENVDFYPTLAALTGLEAPSHLAGVSQAAVLDDPKAKLRDSAFTQHAAGYTVRTDRYRYTEWGDNGSGGAELYDHESDPAEMVNLAGQKEHAATIAGLARLLHQRIASAKELPEGLTRLAPEPNDLRTKNQKRRAAKAKAAAK